jgi:hypothetical protein
MMHVVLQLSANACLVQTKEFTYAGEKTLEGAWKQSDTDKNNLVRIEPLRMVQFRSGELRFVRVAYQNDRIFLVGIGGSREPLGKFLIEKEILIFEDAAGKKHKFHRLAKDPPESKLVSVPLAEAKPVDRKKVQEVQQELARREKVGAKLREEFRAASKDNANRAAKIKEMANAVADDTRFLIGLVKEIGWIDSGRFGYAAQDSAVLFSCTPPTRRSRKRCCRSSGKKSWPGGSTPNPMPVCTTAIVSRWAFPTATACMSRPTRRDSSSSDRWKIVPG